MAKPHTHKLIKQFDEAARAHEMRGSMPPGDEAEIVADYTEAKRRLVEYVEKLGG